MKLQSIFYTVARAIFAPVTVALCCTCACLPAGRFEYSPSRRRLYIPRV
jgi:hypothetical protein